MKKVKRVLALLLALVLAAGLLSSFALAAQSVSRRGNSTITVETGKAPWYCWWQKPQVTIKNTGKESITVHAYNSNNQMIQHVETLKPGRSTTFNLAANQVCYVTVMGHWTLGNTPNFAVTAKRLVKNMW